CHRAQRHKLIVRTGNVNVFELFRIQTIDTFNLRNDLVTTAGNIEAINKNAADRGRHVSTNLLHIETKGSNFVVIENNLGLRLIDFSVDICKPKNASLHRLHLKLLREFKDPLRVGCGSDDETHREAVAAWKSRRHDGEHLNSRNSPELLLDDRQIVLCWRFACAPWFQHHSAKALIRFRDLKRESRVRNILEDFPRGVG